MTALLLFVSTFALVLALGLQSLNVNGGHKVLAALTSLVIGAANLAVLKVMPGPLGIVTSMAIHPWVARRFGRRS